MMQLYAVLSVVFVSLLSLLGALFLVFERKVIENLVTYTLALSSGILLGAAFLDVLPEGLAKVNSDTAFIYVLTGIVVFFGLEKLISWHHHADEDKELKAEKPVAYLTLIGDGIHNFMDGLVIGISYLVSIPLGLITTVAIVGHEIPHELSDFVVLIYGGFSNKKALAWNFLSGLTATLGTLIVLFASQAITAHTDFLLPFAAGNFIYIASSDLIPELHKKRQPGASAVQLVLLILGIAIIYFLKQNLH